MYPKKGPHQHIKKSINPFVGKTTKIQRSEVPITLNIEGKQPENQQCLDSIQNESGNMFNQTFTPRMIHTQRNQRKFQQMSFKNPILICKKQHQQKKNNFDQNKIRKINSQRKVIYSQKNLKVQPFQPVKIPTREKRKLPELETEYYNTSTTRRQIQIYLDNGQKNNATKSQQLKQDLDPRDKQCLKKLFKKIHKLTDDYILCQKSKEQLEKQFKNFKDMHKKCFNNELIIENLKSENMKLKEQSQSLKRQRSLIIRQKDLFIKQLNRQKKNSNIRNSLDDSAERSRSRKKSQIKQTIKQIVIEKPIQIIKYIPGPQRVVQKIVNIEVPKYIQVQKFIEVPSKNNENKIQHKVIEIEKPIIVEKLVYIDKPTYVDKLVYVDRPIYIQKQVEKKQIISKAAQQIKVQLAKSPYVQQAIYKKNSKLQSQTPYQVPVPYTIEVPVYIEKPIYNQQILQKIESLEKELQDSSQRNQELAKQNYSLKQQISKLNISIDILKRHNQQKNREVQQLVRNYNNFQAYSQEQFLYTTRK